MRCLITGVRGFLGSHLYKRLVDLGHSVSGIDNLMHPCWNEVPYKYGDVRNIEDMRPFFLNCDIVFHLAAQISVDKSIISPRETIDINILGTQNVLELAREYGVKVILASSSEIYGSAEAEFMDETHPLKCASPYGASKIAADRLCYSYFKTFGMDVVIVRNFNTFGEFQSDDSYGGVIAKFVTAALNEMPLLIYGSGAQQRDYMHVKDAMQAYELSMEFPAGSVVNFGTGKTIEINELADKIIEFTGSISSVEWVKERKGEVQRLCAGIGKARGLGFEPKTDFWKDLQRYIEWKKG